VKKKAKGNKRAVSKKVTVKSPPLPPPRKLALLHGRWIVALLLERNTYEFIQRVLENDDLPCPTEAEIESLRSALAIPKGLKLTTTSHKTSVTYLQQFGLTTAFHDAPGWKQVQTILKHPRERELVEAGLLLDVPVDALALMVSKHLKTRISIASVALYGHVFCDTRSVVRAQLRVLVQARVRLAVRRALGSEVDELAVMRAVSADARMLAASLPCSKVAWASVLMSLGYSPQKAELSAVVDSVADIAAVRAGTMLMRGEDGDERRAESCAAILQRMRQVRETLANPEADLLKKLATFKIAHSTKPVVTVAELLARGDGVSVDNAPPATTIFDEHGGDDEGGLDADPGP
jgi:hypothetical protein